MLVALDNKGQTILRHTPLVGVPVLVAVLLMLQGCSSRAANSTDQEGQHEQLSGPQAMLAADTKAISIPTYSLCDPPCWRGIIPGKSTDQQVQPLVEHMPGYERRVIQYDDGPEVTYGWDSGSTVGYSNWSTITTKNGVVKEINILYDKANYTLGDVVDKFGPPEKVEVDQLINGSDVIGPDGKNNSTATHSLVFHYFTKGLYFSTDYWPSPGNGAERNMKVVVYHYATPTTWEAYEATRYAMFSDWAGFKK